MNKLIKKEQLAYDILYKQLRSNTNKKVMKFELIRRKVLHIAHDNGYNMGQLLILAAYNAIVDSWSAETDDEVQLKFDSLFKIEQIIVKTDRLRDIMDIIDMTT